MTRIPLFVLLILCAAGAALAQLPASPVSTVQVRQSVTPDTVRLVLDLPDAATFEDRTKPSRIEVAVNLPLTRALPAITLDDPIIPTATVGPDADGKLLLMASLTKPRKTRIFMLPAADGKPARLVVDILKRFRDEETRELKPGITYTRLEEQTDAGLRVTHLLDVDTHDPHVRLHVVPARGERERVSEMVARTGAIGGVNGGFFLDGTRPVGLLKSDGQWFSAPIWGRTAAAFPATGAPVLGNPHGTWRVVLPDGTTRDAADWFDAMTLPETPGLTVVNGNTVSEIPANADGTTVVLHGGRVQSAIWHAPATKLTPGDLALVLHGDDAMTLGPQLGAYAQANATLVVEPAWAEYPDAAGAGPRLLQDGKITVTAQAERFKPDIAGGRPARTAMGITADGHVLFAAVEAPGPYGGGISLEEMAAWLQARGAVDAMNFDGGGSTSMAIGKDTVNYPAGAWVRPVACGILVYWTGE